MFLPGQRALPGRLFLSLPPVKTGAECQFSAYQFPDFAAWASANRPEARWGIEKTRPERRTLAYPPGLLLFGGVQGAGYRSCVVYGAALVGNFHDAGLSGQLNIKHTASTYLPSSVLGLRNFGDLIRSQTGWQSQLPTIGCLFPLKEFARSISS